VKTILSFSKADCNRQLYQTSHSTKHSPLHVYGTLTFHRHTTRSEKCNNAKHKSRIIIINMKKATTNKRTFKKCPSIWFGLYWC